MTKRAKTCLYLVILAAAAASLACGGGASLSGSDAGSPPVAASAPAAVGATIQGTVRSGTAAANGVSAASLGGIRVSVMGTAVQVTTDGNGRFTINGVPEGSAELRFEGKGLDARLTIGGLVAGQTLTLTVEVNGNSVTRVGDDDHAGDGSEVELRGAVDSVSASTNSLMVAGRKVTLTSSTRILDPRNSPIALGSLVKGDVVEVDGVAQSDGSVAASTIKVEGGEGNDDGGNGDDDHNQGQVEFEGSVTALSPLTIGGRQVTTNPSTLYFGAHHSAVPASDILKLGNKVDVEGQLQSDKSVLATKIQLED